MADIFICYKSEEKARLQPLVEGLEAAGWSVFWDRKVKAGDNWRKVLVRELHTARCVVVAWSEASVESDYVLEEADEGKARNALIPLKLDAVAMPYGQKGDAMRGSDGLGRQSSQRGMARFDRRHRR